MKIVRLVLPMVLFTAAASAENVVPPEIVQLENVTIHEDMKTIYVGNNNKHYVLYCNTKADGCITPEQGSNYLLFDANTRWKMPGATVFLTLSIIQDYTVKYNSGENIGLVPQGDAKGGLGMFLLDPTGGGYEQDVVFSDGPIIYGTGMKDQDRQNAWKHFFATMVDAVARQQGTEALGVKLARRCLPSEDFCTTMLDANLIGIGGIREPRKVLVTIGTDKKDLNLQVFRMVCTWPTKELKVCRDFNTGKLVADMPN